MNDSYERRCPNCQIGGVIAALNKAIDAAFDCKQGPLADDDVVQLNAVDAARMARDLRGLVDRIVPIESIGGGD